MKKTSLLLVLLALSTSALAEQSLLLFGASRHGSCDARRYDCSLREKNPGAGLELAEPLADYHVFVRGGSYRDSLGKDAYFAAGGARRSWEVGDGWQAGAGIMVGYLDGSGINGLAGLPFVTIGGRLLQLEIGYLPEMNWSSRYLPATTTFSVRWPLQ